MAGEGTLGGLRPELAAYLERRAAASAAAPDDVPLEERRADYERTVIEEAGPGPEMAALRDTVVPVGDVPVRVYVPDAPLPRGAVLYVHGGGWIMGSIAAWDAPCRTLAAASGAVVVSVDYRLAPEHPFPAGLEDVWNTLCWMEANAPSLGAQRGVLAVAGDSAGGALAAAVARRAVKRRGGPTLSLQALICPALDAAMASDSYRELGAGYGLDAAEMASYWANHLQDADRADPDASPLGAEDLRKLPPALVLTASHDPLRDEGEAYAQRLRDAGVAVQAERFEGTIHGFTRMLAVTPAAGEAIARVATALQAAFAPGREHPPSPASVI